MRKWAFWVPQGLPRSLSLSTPEHSWILRNILEHPWAHLSPQKLFQSLQNAKHRACAAFLRYTTKFCARKSLIYLVKVRNLKKTSRTDAIFKKNAKTARAVCEKHTFPKHSEVGIMHLYDVFTIHPRISWPKSTYLRWKNANSEKKYEDWCDFRWKQQNRSNCLREIAFCLSTRISKHCACATFLRCALEFSFARPKIAYLRRKNAISEKALEACCVFQWKQQNRSNCMRKYTSKHCCGIPRPLPEHSQSTPRKVSEHCQKSCKLEIRATEEESMDR